MSSVLNTTTQPTQETKIALMEEQIAQFVEKMAAKNAEIEELKKNKSSHQSKN